MEMTKLYAMNIRCLENEDAAALSPLRREKAGGYLKEKDRLLSLAAGVLVDRALQERGLRERDVTFSYGPFGKPFLAGYPDIHFSISHGGSMAAVVFSDSEVGCDIEAVIPYDRDVAVLSFTSGEIDEIERSGDRDTSFTTLWTEKESFLKALGVGLGRSMRSFEIRRGEQGPVLIQNIDSGEWKISTVAVDNHIISICAEA